MKQIQLKAAFQTLQISALTEMKTQHKVWFFSKTDNPNTHFFKKCRKISQILQQHRHKIFTSDPSSSWNTFSNPRMMEEGRTHHSLLHHSPNFQAGQHSCMWGFKLPSTTSTGYQSTGKISRRHLINTWMLQGEELLKFCGSHSKQNKIPTLKVQERKEK